jgi:transposase-like protein
MVFMENKEISCPKCHGKNLIKRGFRKTDNRGLIQRYSCKDCGLRFVEKDGFYRMRNSPQKITLCLDLFYRGVSTRKVQEHLQAFYPHNSSWVSVYKWIVKYSRMISKFTDRLKLKVGEEIQVDEMEYKTLGKPSWFIDCMDTKTKFMVASNYSRFRTKKMIKLILNKAKEKIENQIKICTTDAYCGYDKIVLKTWGYNLKNNKYNIAHNKVNARRGEGFNYPIERLHNNIRARTKIFRGFHGSINSANAIMKGFEVYYNFIRKHMAIGCCPYELAIPELKDKLNGNNK